MGFLLSTNLVGQVVDLDNYLQLIRERSLVLKQSSNQIDLAKTDIHLAKAALLPSVALDFTYQRDFTKSFLFLNEEDPSGFFPDKFRTNFNNNITADLVAEQSIYNPAAKASHKLAILAAEQAQLSHLDLSQELLNQGTQLFWQAIFTRESLQVLEANQELAKEQWEQMQALFEQGYASELQVRQSESFYKRTIPQLESARNTYKLLRNELKALANLPPDHQLELEGTMEIADSEAGYFLPDSSLERNTQIRALHKQMEIANQQIKVAEAAKYPTIKANLGYNFNAQDNHLHFDNNNRLFYGQLSLQIPIYTGGYNNAQIQKAKIDSENARLEFQNQQSILKKDLANAQLSVWNALQKVKEEKEVIQLSKRELEIANESRKAGVITPLELKEMRLGLTQSRLRLINAYLDLRIARLQMNRITGRN